MFLGTDKDPGISEKGWLASRFTRAHSGILIVGWMTFGILTLVIVSQGLDDAPRRPAVVVSTTLGSILGPMSGAISRDGQSCCLAFSLSLLPYCLSALALAALVQIVVPPRGFWLCSLRLLAWGIGCVVWFGGGIVSLGHALS